MLFRNPRFLIASVLILLLGAVYGGYHFGRTGSASGAALTTDTHDHAEDQVWTCSMHPQIRQGEPGTCPICGMDLIPAGSGGSSTDRFQLEMTEEAIALAGVRTWEVVRGSGASTLALPGRVEADPGRLVRVNAFVEGRVTAEHTGFEGAAVRKGDPLFTLRSPELVVAWQEWQVDGAAHEALRTRLRYWGLTDAQIDAFAASPTPVEEVRILAPASGIVRSRMVAEDDRIMPGMTLYEIADLSRIWVMFDIFEQDLGKVRVGSTIRFEAASAPGTTSEGRISWVAPEVDGMKRTVAARVEVANADGRWKPGMRVSGRVEAASGQVLLVPETAVLWTGPRSLVYVRLPDHETPVFEARDVVVGARYGDQREIRSGLQAGDVVVVSGTFAVDAEFQLAGKAHMMESRGEATEPGVPEAVLSAYLRHAEALVASDAAAALRAAADLKAAVAASPRTGAPWAPVREAMLRALEHADHRTDLASMRKALPSITEPLSGALRAAPSGQAFLQFCPMAFDNQGAEWIASSRTIRNPYLPETMLGCGEVRARL